MSRRSPRATSCPCPSNSNTAGGGQVRRGPFLGPPNCWLSQLKRVTLTPGYYQLQQVLPTPQHCTPHCGPSKCFPKLVGGQAHSGTACLALSQKLQGQGAWVWPGAVLGRTLARGHTWPGKDTGPSTALPLQELEGAGEKGAQLFPSPCTPGPPPK